MTDKMTNAVETWKRALKNTVKTLAYLAVISWTQAQANDLLARCDINWDNKISNRKTYKNDWVSKEVAKKEYKCSLKVEKQNAREGLDNAREGLDNARKGLDNAQEGLNNAQEGLDNAQEGLDNEQEGLDNAQEEWRQLDKDIKKLEWQILAQK